MVSPDRPKATLGRDATDKIIQVLRPLPGGAENVAFTASSAASSAFQEDTHTIRIVATETCFYRVGDSPTATTGDSRLPQNVVEYLRVNGGEKIAAIRESSSGNLNVTEMSG